MTIKTVLAGLGIALLSACSGNLTGPTAPAQASGIKTPGGRNNFTGYVVAENDSLGGQGLAPMGQQIMRRVPAADSVSVGSAQ